MAAQEEFPLGALPPRRTARTLTVHDRKLSVDSLPSDPSMYLLAREWVANNPFRQLVRPIALPASGVQLPPPLPPTALSTARLVPAKRKIPPSDDGTDDLFQTRASPALLLKHHVMHARDVRRWIKVQRQSVLDRFRPRLLKLLCGGQGLQQANMPMPVQPNQIETDGFFPQAHSPPERPLPSEAAAAVAEAVRATADVLASAPADGSIARADLPGRQSVGDRQLEDEELAAARQHQLDAQHENEGGDDGQLGPALNLSLTDKDI